MSEELIKDVFHLSPDVRYVAVSRHGNLTMRERGELASASSPDSDRYEELLVKLAAELTDCLCEAVEGSRRLQPAR